MQVLYAAALFFVLAVMLLAGPAVLFVLGPKYQQSALVFEILIWAVVPMFMNYALNIFLLARGREKVFLWTASVCTAVNVIANLLLIPRYSYVAAAGVTILTELVLLGQNVVLVFKTLGYVPVPKRAVWNSLVFLLLLAASHWVAHIAAPLAVGALLVFAVYLHVNGSLPWSANVYETTFRGVDT
jgi:O-antigen/teichoic acid export membrane protein